jgi:curved DNA-binding protein
MDHYQTLGVAKNATPDDIKKAYRRLASIHHPDKGGDTAMFQKVEEAYRVLSDPQQRQAYDNPQPQGFGGFPGGFSFSTNGFDINDLMGQMFGMHHSHPRQPQRPTYRTLMNITLEQVFSGSEQVIQLQTQNGVQTAKIQIPQNVENGGQLRYDNLVPNATLLVEFRIQPHYKFERRGFDLYSTINVSVLDLIVGTSVEFTTISGRTLEVTIPPKTQPNSMLRVSGEGMHRQNARGDQILLIKSFIPDIIDDTIVNSILASKSNNKENHEPQS